MKQNPKRLGNKTKPDNQRARFITKARELECDESGKPFESAFKRIVPPKKPKKPT